MVRRAYTDEELTVALRAWNDSDPSDSMTKRIGQVLHATASYRFRKEAEANGWKTEPMPAVRQKLSRDWIA